MLLCCSSSPPLMSVQPRRTPLQCSLPFQCSAQSAGPLSAAARSTCLRPKKRSLSNNTTVPLDPADPRHFRLYHWLRLQHNVSINREPLHDVTSKCGAFPLPAPSHPLSSWLLHPATASCFSSTASHSRAFEMFFFFFSSLPARNSGALL